MIAAGIAALVLIGWYLLLWSPTKDDLDAAKSRRQTAESRQEQLNQAIARLRSAQRNEPLRRAQLETLRTAIPDTPNLAQFILDTNDAAARAGIDFVSIAPTEPRATAAAATTTTTTTAAGATTTTAAGTATTAAPAGPAPAEIGITMQVQGGYFQVLDFLNRLDRLPRLVVIDAINISGDQSARLTVALNARMFLRSIPAGFAGAPATTTTTAAGGAGGTTTTTAAGGAGATTTTAAGGAGGAGTTTTTAGAGG